MLFDGLSENDKILICYYLKLRFNEICDDIESGKVNPDFIEELKSGEPFRLGGD